MKTAVITGCNRGLGEGVAKALMDENWEVIGVNRTPGTRFKNNAAYMYKEIICDVSDSWQVNERLDDVVKCDLLVLNAGIRRFNSVEEMSLKDWEDSVNTNLNGVFYVANKLVKKVKENKGDIIVIGSHSEKYTFENGSAYCSTKGALKEFSECLMQEVRYDDVRVTYMSLGSIKNREHGGDESWKLTPEQVGETVVHISYLPKNILIPYIDVRPIKPLKDSRPGIEKLQYV